MVVVIIIAALAGMVLPHLMDKPDEAKERIARAEIQGIYTALKLYKLDTGRYPTTEEGLKALVAAPASAKKWKGPYLDKKKVNDPWDTPYSYNGKGSSILKVDVWSAGRDMEPNTDDDVRLEE